VFIEGALIGIAGVIIIAKSTYSIFYPEVIHDLLLGAIIIGVTGTINGGLGYYMIRKGKLLRSITIEAGGHHLLTDTVTSCGLVIGLLLIYFT
ncbi:cation transporter, partial [Undibacterium sp. CCC2.1]|uniref:cation transporter n=1 Tax=Undibacterium sp. CCC2.1 TaxID=3048604 RepID=UPI002B237D1B